MNKEDNSKIYSKDKITFHELEDNTSATGHAAVASVSQNMNFLNLKN